MCICPNQITTAVTALAAILAEGRSASEISLLAAVFTQLGDTLATISIQKSICEATK